MPLRVRTTNAIAKLRRLRDEVRIGAERVSRREARKLANDLRRVAPFSTGKLRREIRVRKVHQSRRRRSVRGRQGMYQVYISRSQFPGFFYPILYLRDMYRKIRRRRPFSRNRFRLALFTAFRRVFIRA